MISCMLELHNDSIDPERKELLLDKLTSLELNFRVINSCIYTSQIRSFIMNRGYICKNKLGNGDERSL